MPKKIVPATLKSWLHDDDEVALFDIREAGEFGEGHLFYAVSLPYSRLELDLPRLAPRRDVRLVLQAGADNALALRAAGHAERLGYTLVSILDGGTDAWVVAGYPLFKGVNVVSKAFGELAEHAFGTPSISAEDLHGRLARGENIVVLDGRPRDEFAKMSIPGATCCPNAELTYRWQGFAPDPETTIVINCAGRTRSIIGAQGLRNLGIPNPVYALRNGTMGWRLSGYELDHGKERHYAEAIDLGHKRAQIEKAHVLAAKWHLPLINVTTARSWLQSSDRSTYLLDVRTAEEFAAGHAPGAQHAPGGQLVQATDQWLGARGGRVILLDDALIRAVSTGRWLHLMGWEVAILSGGAEAWVELPAPEAAFDILPTLPVATPAQLKNALILDLRPSQAYRDGHIAGARWAIRSRLPAVLANIPPSKSIVLATSESNVARAFAADLSQQNLKRAAVLEGDVNQWRRAGFEIESTPDAPTDAERIDYLFFVHDRHHGNLQAAQQYLDWETGLVAHLDAAELAAFGLPPLQSAE